MGSLNVKSVGLCSEKTDYGQVANANMLQKDCGIIVSTGKVAYNVAQRILLATSKKSFIMVSTAEV